jgi:hypothetical protein
MDDYEIRASSYEDRFTREQDAEWVERFVFNYVFWFGFVSMVLAIGLIEGL